MVILPRSCGDLAGVKKVSLGSEKLIHQVAHRQPVNFLRRLPSIMKVVLLGKILLKGGVGVIPSAKVVLFPTDILGPALRSVRE